jgi:hypothetical protein
MDSCVEFDDTPPNHLKGGDMKRYLVALASFMMVACSTAYADSIQLHGASKHAGERQYNEQNYGLGYRLNISHDFDVQVGYYRNSLDKDTYYGIVDYKPLQYSGLKLGVFGGVGTGYASTLLGGLVLDVPVTKRVTLTARVIPAISGVTPAVIALEIGFVL